MARVFEREFLAADAYSQWRQRVKAAEKAVRIYSPYYDDLLVKLLGNSTLRAECLSVVTDLSPDSGALTYRKQLLATRRLLSQKVEIRSLPRLHSKVLLIDGAIVTVGSQNFTSYARRSKETTAVPVLDMSDSRFVETLEHWYETAELVDPELVDMLLGDLSAPLETARGALEALSTEYHKVVANYTETKRVLAQQRLEAELAKARAAAALQRAAAASPYSAGQSVAYVRLRERVDGNYLDYWRLEGEGGVDLTRWRWVDDSGRLVDTVPLKRLFFYPAVLAPGMRMGFARVGKRGITYVSRRIQGCTLTINGIHLAYAIECPDAEPDGANLVVTFSRSGQHQSDGYQMRLLFDGEQAERIAEGWIGDPGRNRWRASLVQSTYEDPDAWEALIGAVLEPRTLLNFIENKNAHRFFPRNEWLRITVIRFLGTPVLLVQ